MVCFIKCHQFLNNICIIVVSFRAWSSGLLHVLVFRVRRFDSRRIQSKRARMMPDGVPEADLPVGKAHMKRRRRRAFPATSLRRVHTYLLEAITHPCPVTHLSCLLAVSPTCSLSAEGVHRSTTCPLRRPFRRMVCTGHYLLVLFGGWSAELPYLSFSVGGLQYISPTCSGL